MAASARVGGTAGDSRVAQRILGVDPGLTRCGFAIVEMNRDRTGESVHVEVTGTRSDQELAERILAIQRAAERLLDVHAPDVLAIERVFAQNNAPTVIGTAQASGVVIAAAAARGIPVAWHTPSEVKAAVTDDGAADKAAVARMVQRILRLPTLPKPVDATDAYAVAICHAWRSGIGTRQDMSAGTRTHQGARTALQKATESRTGGLTAAQQAWKDAERRAAGGRAGRVGRGDPRLGR
ncbi:MULTISPECIES: crossover junction endodeoxyribonuclease RuvC [Nesterenkonia]|uniref:Crossover junction endodeoxyribonuclease RuvC n=1 Tax=Nesterenkonia xinjiangensis TaxID=225327 RepID=A0A7Z0KB51_9MICC|nr:MULTISPECIES: crossover junction endodeoxyribonuclease RuvC [Nesterenkonia]MDZ5078421.1 crossover junction endodeoxyribonuclease RuvC [Nesterenkonia sp. HG001]NYJ79593.1 crossover junction endodeoxyribonuclease RuvC [Nesterenkonia xinjiangensis]